MPTLLAATSTKPPVAPPAEELTPLAFDILRDANNAARTNRFKKVAQLRAHLLSLYPGKQADIDQSLRFWAKQLHGVH